MISRQEFESVTWSVEDDLLVEELVSDADRLLQSRKSGPGAADSGDISQLHSPKEAVLPENAIELTSIASELACDRADDQVLRLSDLEDIGLVLDRRRYRPTGVSVTDFTEAEWCQQQFALALSAKLPREVTQTAAMTAGSDLHRALELEVKRIVQVEIQTREDAWALRLIETIEGLRGLMRKGITREVYVFSKLQGQWVKGVIDELLLDELGKVRIVEQKTRRNSNAPSEAQKDTARLQVMMYRTLLLGLAEACTGDSVAEILALHRLDGKALLSKEVLKHARTSGVAMVMSLEDLLGSLHAAALKLPPCSEEMQVRYLWQEDGSLLGTMSVWWDPDIMQRQVSAHLAMLCGVTSPEKVLPEQDWKCSYCMFYHACGGPSPTAEKPGQQSATTDATAVSTVPVQNPQACVQGVVLYSGKALS